MYAACSRRHRLLLLPAALEDGAQVLAVDVLHRDEVLAVRARELVDARDVAVAQQAGDLGLVDQHLDEVVVLGEVGEHALDRDQVGVTAGVEGLGPVDLGHPAERDAVEQVVPAELLGPSHRARTKVRLRRSGWQGGRAPTAMPTRDARSSIAPHAPRSRSRSLSAAAGALPRPTPAAIGSQPTPASRPRGARAAPPTPAPTPRPRPAGGRRGARRRRRRRHDRGNEGSTARRTRVTLAAPARRQAAPGPSPIAVDAEEGLARSTRTSRPSSTIAAPAGVKLAKTEQTRGRRGRRSPTRRGRWRGAVHGRRAGRQATFTGSPQVRGVHRHHVRPEEGAARPGTSRSASEPGRRRSWRSPSIRVVRSSGRADPGRAAASWARRSATTSRGTAA